MPTCNDIQQKIVEYFDIKDPIEMKWVDDQGDKIALATDDDVIEGFSTTSYNEPPPPPPTPPPCLCVYVYICQNTYQNICSPITTITDSPITCVPIDEDTTYDCSQTNCPTGNCVNECEVEGNTTTISPICNSPITTCTISDSPICTNIIEISDVNVITGNCVTETCTNNCPVINHVLDHNHLIQMCAQQDSGNPHKHFSTSAPSAPSSPSAAPSSDTPFPLTSSPTSSQTNSAPLLPATPPSQSTDCYKRKVSAKIASKMPQKAVKDDVVQRKQFLRKENVHQWLPTLYQLKDIGFDNTSLNVHLLNYYEGDLLLVLTALSKGF